MASRRMLKSLFRSAAGRKSSTKLSWRGVVASFDIEPNNTQLFSPISSIRHFSKGNKKDRSDEDIDSNLLAAEDLVDEDGDETTKIDDRDDDPFGVNFDDGDDKIGPVDNLPPLYKRDAATGRLTGVIEKELTAEEKHLLKADPHTHDKVILKRISQQWEEAGQDESGLPAELNKLGDRVRTSDMGLNILGRSVKAQASKETLDDGSELGRDRTGFSQALTPSEFEAFSKFMEKAHNTTIRKDDIPVQETGKKRGDEDEEIDDPDTLDLSLKWLTARAQRQMDDLADDDPFADLMPGDLSPTRLVNRKRAKPIPTNLLHHNNVALLSRYVTPTGQIKNRVQTRLGARDQRRVAKLVKRARALGLIPHVGQFKVEQHGWIHAADMNEEKEWEKELSRRGLVIRRSKSADSERDN